MGQSKRDLDLESHEGRTKGSGRGTGAEHVKTLRFYAPQSGTMSQSEPSYVIDKSRDPTREFVKLDLKYRVQKAPLLEGKRLKV